MTGVANRGGVRQRIGYTGAGKLKEQEVEGELTQ